MTGYTNIPAKDILQTYTGRTLQPLNPWPGDFDITDIAWALAMQCRYNGHTQMFYSVATHCILVAKFCPPHLRLEGLLHDASEAYLCDMPSPLKHAMPEYRKHEEALESVIATQYHLVHPIHPLVKRADDYVFQLECGLVMGGAIAERFEIPDRSCPIAEFSAILADKQYVEETIIAHAHNTPDKVAALYLAAFSDLMKTRGADIQAAQEAPNGA